MPQNIWTILGVRIDQMTIEKASDIIIQLSHEGHSYICAANVHMIMECYDDFEFQDVVNSATMIVPDGKPLVWALKILGAKSVERVTGSSLTLEVLKGAQENGISVGFYGGQVATLEQLIQRIKRDFPNLKIGYVFSPPFNTLSEEEQQTIVNSIIQSGTKILFVGLGCPKQEKWMAKHKNKLPTVMIVIGSAFDFLSGSISRAPKYFQEIGLEWLFRFLLEPKRLWKRYFVDNPRFIVKFSWQLFKSRK